MRGLRVLGTCTNTGATPREQRQFRAVLPARSGVVAEHRCRLQRGERPFWKLTSLSARFYRASSCSTRRRRSRLSSFFSSIALGLSALRMPLRDTSALRHVDSVDE